MSSVKFYIGNRYNTTMLFQLVFVFGLVGLSIQKTEMEIKSWFFSQVVECSKDYPITPEELLMMKDHKVAETDKSKCLCACVFRKTNWLDDAGLYDLNKALEWLETEYTADEKKKEDAKTVFNNCKSVNDETVSDGEKGCDRAFLMAKCLTDNAKSFGFLH